MPPSHSRGHSAADDTVDIPSASPRSRLPRRHRTASPDVGSDSSTASPTPSSSSSTHVLHVPPSALAAAVREYGDDEERRSGLAPSASAHLVDAAGDHSIEYATWQGSGIALGPLCDPPPSSTNAFDSRSPDSTTAFQPLRSAMPRPPIPPAPPGSLTQHASPPIGGVNDFAYSGTNGGGGQASSSSYSSGWPSAPGYTGGSGGSTSDHSAPDPFPRFPFPSGDTAGITFAPPPASPDDDGLLGGANATVTFDKERKRIMQACEPCRMRKAKKFLDCDYAVERKMRGPNRVKKPTKPKEPKPKKTKKGKKGKNGGDIGEENEADTMADMSVLTAADSSFDGSRSIAGSVNNMRIGEFGHPIVGPFDGSGGGPSSRYGPPSYGYELSGPPPPPELGYSHQAYPIARQPPNAWRPMAGPTSSTNSSNAFVSGAPPSFAPRSPTISTDTSSQYPLTSRGPSFPPLPPPPPASGPSYPSLSALPTIYQHPVAAQQPDSNASRQQFLSRTLPGLPATSNSTSSTPMLYQPNIGPPAGATGGAGGDYGTYSHRAPSSPPPFPPPAMHPHRFSGDSSAAAAVPPSSFGGMPSKQPPTFTTNSSHASYDQQQHQHRSSSFSFNGTSGGGGNNGWHGGNGRD